MDSVSPVSSSAVVVKPRGFAALSPEVRASISSKGGKSAHAKGTAHKWTREQAIVAGRKGGMAPRREKSQERVYDNPRDPMFNTYDAE